MRRKGLLTKAFRQMSIDKDREVKLSQLLLAINAVLASLQAVAPIMDSESGTMLYHGTEEEVLQPFSNVSVTMSARCWLRSILLRFGFGFDAAAALGAAVAVACRISSHNHLYCGASTLGILILLYT